MTACEECWTEANRRALTLGGYVADHYREVLTERDSDPLHNPPRDASRLAHSGSDAAAATDD